MLPLYPARILPPVFFQPEDKGHCSKTCLPTFTLCRGCLESYTSPKRRFDQPPKNIWIQRDRHRFLPILSFGEVQPPRQQQLSPAHGTGDSWGWLGAWSPPTYTWRAAPVLPTITLCIRDQRDAQTNHTAPWDSRITQDGLQLLWLTPHHPAFWSYLFSI